MQILKNDKKIIAPIMLTIFILVAMLCFVETSGCFASAAPIDVVLISQTEKVYYCDANFLNNEGGFVNFSGEAEAFKNSLYNALTVTVNGTKTIVHYSDITFDGYTDVVVPKTYKGIAKVKYNGNTYENELSIVISKAPLHVVVKINGATSATVKEGELYTTSVTYNGFVGNDTLADLEIPAIIQQEPKRPIANYTMVADSAKSNLYEFIYEGAILNITKNSNSTLEVLQGTEKSLVLKGSYSPYGVLNFVNVGVSPANVDYVKIENEVAKYYSTGSLLQDYKEAEVFKVDLTVDGNIEENQASDIVFKLADRNAGKGKYMVIAFYNSGLTEIINGTESDGYLYFDAADLGDFVVLTPIESIQTATLLAVIIGGLALLFIIIILISIFRRKY